MSLENVTTFLLLLFVTDNLNEVYSLCKHGFKIFPWLISTLITVPKLLISKNFGVALLRILFC